MIISNVHKDYRISVRAIPNALDSTQFVPSVDISLNDGKRILGMVTTQAFAAQSDAERCGFEMGKNWIDEQLRETEHQRRRV
jgi:hypothetical protein